MKYVGEMYFQILFGEQTTFPRTNSIIEVSDTGASGQTFSPPQFVLKVAGTPLCSSVLVDMH
jgi:hypothetical protein